MKTARMQFTLADVVFTAVLLAVALAAFSPLLINRFGLPTYTWPPRPLGWLELYSLEARVWCLASITVGTLVGAAGVLFAIRRYTLNSWQRCGSIGLGACGVMLVMLVALPIQRRWAGAYAAAAALKAYAEVQTIYRLKDYDGDGVLENARSFDELVETKPGALDLQLVDLSFAAADYSKFGTAGKAGYVFKVLLAQGPHAKGGRRGYVTTDKSGRVVVDGFALAMAPVAYDLTGRDMFIINDEGFIYQKDCGPNTAKILQEMTEYDPDSTWTRAE